MKYYVYILLSEKDSNFYVGFTADIERRLIEHNKGKVTATRSRIPFKLIHHEEFDSKSKAIEREKYIKGKGGIRFKSELRSKLGLK